MFYATSGFRRTRAMGVLAMSALLALSSSVAARAGSETDVTATYRLSFNGFDVGRYNFSSKSDGKSYSAESQASISALFGAFKWRGDIAASGGMAKETPQPGGYRMTFSTKKKQGSVTLGFAKGDIKKVSVVPEKPPHPDAVPVKADQLKNVYDPLSAIFALTNGSANPCTKRIPVFDGKVRFDLALSYKGVERLKDADRSGLPRELTVCRVKYLPIAGHKPKDFDKPWVGYDRIEIALRAVPSANIYVPYRISIPTTIGSADMVAERIEIGAPNQPRIALGR